MLKLNTLLALLFLQAFSATAQNDWTYLPNNNLVKGAAPSDSAYRIEDVYFTDTLTGFAVCLPGRILKTTDGGTNWQRKNSVASEVGFRSIEFLDDGKTGIAGSLGATAQLLRTDDYGETWQDYTSSLTDTTTGSTRNNICGIAHFGNNFYAIGSWGSNTGKFHKSIDKGLTWHTTYMDTNLIKNMVDVVFISQDTGFVAGARNTESVVLKTTDGGNTWTEVFSDNTLGGRIWKLQALSHQVFVGSIEPLFYPDTVSMIRSFDGGNTWTIIPVGSMAPTAYVGTQGVGFVTPAHGWVGGYYDGYFETSDSGKTWQHISMGYDFNRIFVLDSNHAFAGGHSVYKYSKGAPANTNINQPGKNNTPHKLYPVSPNPASGRIKIEFDMYKAGNLVLEVVHIDGRRSYPITNTYLEKGHYTYYWDASNMVDGNYMVWMGTNEIPLVQKFTVHK